jgi:hypothetical protein
LAHYAQTGQLEPALVLPSRYYDWDVEDTAAKDGVGRRRASQVSSVIKVPGRPGCIVAPGAVFIWGSSGRYMAGTNDG